MALVLNGSGTIAGLSAGGLPDGVITADDLASGVGGKVLQVVQATKAGASYTTSSTYAVLDDHDVTITPSSTSSKVLIVVSVYMNLYGNETTNNTNAYYDLRKNGTSLQEKIFMNFSNLSGDYTDQENRSASFVYLDSPSSTSALTYAMYFKASAGRNGCLAGSSVTAMEIAG